MSKPIFLNFILFFSVDSNASQKVLQQQLPISGSSGEIAQLNMNISQCSTSKNPTPSPVSVVSFVETGGNSPDFQAKELSAQEMLEQYDMQKRFWLGSAVVNPENRDSFAKESEKRIPGSINMNVLMRGSRSRLEQQQEYFQEREELRKKLLQRFGQI